MLHTTASRLLGLQAMDPEMGVLRDLDEQLVADLQLEL